MLDGSFVERYDLMQRRRQRVVGGEQKKEKREGWQQKGRAIILPTASQQYHLHKKQPAQAIEDVVSN